VYAILPRSRTKSRRLVIGIIDFRLNKDRSIRTTKHDLSRGLLLYEISTLRRDPDVVIRVVVT
jgi:hypothetical protein